MTRAEKLFEFNDALHKFSKLVEKKRLLKKLNIEMEECDTEIKYLKLQDEIKKLSCEIEKLEQKVNGILRKVLQKEEYISVVEIDYDDIHVVEKFQDYMNLI